MRAIVSIVVIAPHVFHRTPVTFAETFAECPAVVSVDRRPFVHFVVIGIGVPILAHIVPGSFNAFVEAAALRIAVIRGRLIPAVLIVIMVLGQGCVRDWSGFKSMRLERARRRYAESKQGWCKPFNFVHKVRNLLVQGVQM